MTPLAARVDTVCRSPTENIAPDREIRDTIDQYVDSGKRANAITGITAITRIKHQTLNRDSVPGQGTARWSDCQQRLVTGERRLGDEPRFGGDDGTGRNACAVGRQDRGTFDSKIRDIKD